MTAKTMQAVVFKDKLKVEIERRPIPQIQDPTDVIVKVRYTALCGRYARHGDHHQQQLIPPASFTSFGAISRPQPDLSWAMNSQARSQKSAQG